MIDGTIVRVHQHGAGAKGGLKSGHRPIARRSDDQNRSVGRCARQSRALRPPAGQRHDSVGVEPLIKDIDFEALLADKAFDIDRLRTELNEARRCRHPAQSQPQASHRL